MSHDGVSRRHFFFGALLAGAVPAGGYGSVPSLKALGYKPFNEKLNVAAIDGLRRVLERGQKAGVFRAAIDPVDLHMSISALSVFNVSNRHTFGLIFERDIESPAALIARRDSIIEMIVRFVRK